GEGAAAHDQVAASSVLGRDLGGRSPQAPDRVRLESIPPPRLEERELLRERKELERSDVAGDREYERVGERPVQAVEPASLAEGAVVDEGDEVARRLDDSSIPRPRGVAHRLGDVAKR